MLVDREMWTIREEERVAFDAAQSIHVGVGALDREACHDIIQDFYIMVPSTNFPPALDLVRSSSPMNAIELVNVNSIYEYYVHVSFVNRTTKEIPAGFTAFQPQYDHATYPHKYHAETIPLESSAEFHKTQNKTTSAANYTVEISPTPEMIFSEGSDDQAITVVVTRVGPARKFTKPLTIWGCVNPTSSSRWAVEHGITKSQAMQTAKHLRDDLKHSWIPCAGSPEAGVSLMMPNPTLDQLNSNDVVTTRATVTIPIQINRRQVPNFESYYQTFGSDLSITLRVPRKSDERGDPDDPDASVIADSFQWFEDDEADWVPWERRGMPMPIPMPALWMWREYSGKIPVVVRPAADAQPTRRCLQASATVPEQAIMSDDSACKETSPIHYLSGGARGPMFVDGDSVQELRAKDPAERALLAPLLKPVVSSFPQGRELIHRYFMSAEVGRPPSIYVGETWRKKVARKDRHRVVTSP